MIFNKPSNYPSILSVALITLAISGCGKKEGAANAPSQVVARVNGDEISIHQVNFQLSRLGQMSEEQAKLASKQVLGRLVDQQVLKQKAIETKLDRDPRVLQVLEATKDQILAQAYLEQEMAKASKPSASDIDLFYTDNPELFQNRRVFKIQEIAVEVPNDKLGEIQAAVDENKNINKVADWLKSKNYKLSANASVRSAEQLPLPLLKKLQSLKDGEMVVVQNEHSINIINVATSEAQPIPKDKAKAVIEQFLFNQNKSKFVTKYMEDLKKSAKIEYMGAFADLKNNGNNAAVSSNTKPASAPEPMTKPTEAETSATTQSGDKKLNIEKGLSGL